MSEAQLCGAWRPPPHPLLHLVEGGLVEEVLGGRGEGHVEREEVAAGERLVERHELGAEGADAVGRGVGVIGDHLHAEALGAAADLGAHLRRGWGGGVRMGGE